MNNKIIIFLPLILLFLYTAKTYGEVGCNDEPAEKTCVNIYVKSTVGEMLTDMVVYLEPLDGQVVEQNTTEVVIGQQNKSFTPYISVSQVNAKVNFVNEDDITHHIYSAGSNNKFSFKVRAGQSNASTAFTHATDVAMGCNVHDWMSGYLLVVNTPYFGKTDEQGQISFNITESGKYKIIVWHPQMQSESNRMFVEEIIDANNSVFTFTLKNTMADIPSLENNDDFDFLSDY